MYNGAEGMLVLVSYQSVIEFSKAQDLLVG
jgi:hypothetical protein